MLPRTDRLLREKTAALMQAGFKPRGVSMANGATVRVRVCVRARLRAFKGKGREAWDGFCVRVCWNSGGSGR